MEDTKSIELFNSFEDKIKVFRKNPKNYEVKVKNLLSRQFQNALQSSLIWLFLALLLNYIALWLHQL